MHRFEVTDKCFGKLTVSDHQEVDIAAAEIEIAGGQQPLEIHSHRALARDLLHPR